MDDNENDKNSIVEFTQREWQEYIWALKRVESIVDVDGKEQPLNFLPFLIEEQ